MRIVNHGKTRWVLGLVLGGLVVSTSALAIDNHHIGDGQQMQGGMPEMGRGEIMIGEQVRNGVSAMIHLTPIAATDGSGATHHLMVKFTDISSRKTIVDGNVTVKVVAPGGKKVSADKKPRITQYVVGFLPDIPEGEDGIPRNEMGMRGHFGADVTLDQAGTWHFEIAATLPDGQQRQYNANYLVK